MPLKVYNSLTREVEEFVPLEEGRAGIYVCGPTVYGHCHIGHAKSYVAFDVIVKWLRQHFEVRYVQNITDVGHLTDDADEGEDKIAVQARKERIHPLEVVDVYMRSYFEDMEALKVAHPNMYVRASQHITEQIDIIQELIAKGHAYEAGGNVYFDVSSWPEYGILSGRKSEDQVEGTRVGSRSDKRDPRDFALWKTAEGSGHIMRWTSPWGEGYPGWHVECSAMAMKYLGDEFDFHGGGMENKFPHHECEIAQSRAASGHGFARYWLHNNMINVDGQKMGKSLGNSVFIKDVLGEFTAEALRMFLLSTHYARPSNYSRDGMQAATAGIERLANTRRLIEAALEKAPDTGDDDTGMTSVTTALSESFSAAMDDNFNTPIAISTLMDSVRGYNKLAGACVSRSALEGAAAVLDRFAGDVLGLLPAGGAAAADPGRDDALIGILADIRKTMRDEKNWPMSDLIRDRLAGLGIELKDGPDGTTW